MTALLALAQPSRLALRNKPWLRLPPKLTLGLTLLLALALPGAAAHPQAATDTSATAVDDPAEGYSLTDHAAIYFEPLTSGPEEALQTRLNAVLSALEDGRFRQLESHETRFGYTDATAWLALDVPEELGNLPRFYAALDSPLLDRVSLYHLRPDEVLVSHFNAGTALDQRAVRLPGVVMPVDAYDVLQDRLLLAVQTRGSMALSGSLARLQDLETLSNAARQTMAAFYGVILVLLALNLMLFALTRVRSLLYNALFLAATAGHHALSHDVLALLAPGVTWVYLQEIYILLIFLSGIAAILFTRHALILPNATPRIDRAVQVLAMVSAISAVATPLMGVATAYRIAAFLALTVNPLLLAAAAIRWRQGDRSARAMVAAWSLLLVGILLMVLYRWGWLANPVLDEDGTYLLSALCALLLTFALVHRLLLLEERTRFTPDVNSPDLTTAAAGGDRMVEELERSIHQTNQALRSSNRQLEAMQQETAHHTEILRTLFTSSVAIHRIDHTDALLESSLNQLSSLFPDHGFGLIIHGERPGDVRHRAFAGISEPLQTVIIDNTQYLGDSVRSTLRHLLLEQEPDTGNGDRGTHRGWQFLELPDRRRDVQGHLIIHGTDLPQRSMEVLGVFCSQIATAIENRRLSRELEQLANTDPLTGIGNRKVFDDALRDAVQQASSAPRLDFCVLVIDLNGLKRVNDSCGHEAGDEMIRTVAQVIGSCVRREDTIARLGGDEFVVLCPNARMPAAEELAERIAEELALRVLEFVDGDGATLRASPSAAIGTASSHEVAPGAVFTTADARMYDAKERYYADQKTRHGPSGGPPTA